MLTMREVQDKIFELLPTYQAELRQLAEQLIGDKVVDHDFLSLGFIRSGRHIFGRASAADPRVKSGDVEKNAIVPIDYVPCDHRVYVIRHNSPLKDIPKQPPFIGHETCPLCGKMLQVSVAALLSTADLVLVGCPKFKEGKVTVDVLPIFSSGLVDDAYITAMSVPHQRSKNAMTRVDRAL